MVVCCFWMICLLENLQGLFKRQWGKLFIAILCIVVWLSKLDFTSNGVIHVHTPLCFARSFLQYMPEDFSNTTLHLHPFLCSHFGNKLGKKLGKFARWARCLLIGRQFGQGWPAAWFVGPCGAMLLMRRSGTYQWLFRMALGLSNYTPWKLQGVFRLEYLATQFSIILGKPFKERTLDLVRSLQWAWIFHICSHTHEF